MAKEKSLIKIQGTFRGLTFVESKAYGRHVRAARGSNKPALLNEEMEKSKANLIHVNPYGQMIKNALEPYRENFTDGTLWSRLLSFFRSQVKRNGVPDLLALEGFEINKSNLLRSITTPRVDVNFKRESSSVEITIGIQQTRFSIKYIDGYRLTVMAMYPDVDKKNTVVFSETLQVDSLMEEAKPTVVFPLAEKAETLLICLRIDGTGKGELSHNQKTKGMQIVKATRVGEVD